MWPILLDMTKVDCKRMLRRLELEAYGNLVSALRAQGRLSSEKHRLLQEISTTLNIPQERHRAEIRRAVNDERLATIAYCMTGDDTTDEWALEGRRLVPLMPRMVPQTAYSVIADEEANKASIENEKLPVPSSTERKRPLPTTTTELNKNIKCATSEFSSIINANQCMNEESSVKKRKTNMNVESSTLAQHLIMGPPKISRVQQMYRQKKSALIKPHMKYRPSPTQHITNLPKTPRKPEEEPKNISHAQMPTQKVPTENKNVNTSTIVTPPPSTVPVSNENTISLSKITPTAPIVKPAIQSSNSVKVQPTSVVVNAADVASKSIKICPARKVITATSRAQNQSQKLIIVSNSQGNTTSSILQRTLTIPFVKTISMKSLDKLKVINTSSTVTTNTSASMSNQKPKLLTVHTKMKPNSSGKHINIPFIQGVQLQALQNKGAIKMVPLSSTSKLASKSAIISAVTTSNSSPIMTAKPQTSMDHSQENQRNVYIIKNEDIKPSLITNSSENNQNVVVLNVQQKEQKSSVLTEILKASGVIPTDETDELINEDNQEEIPVDQCDIESQISQLTAIPTSEENGITDCETVENTCEAVGGNTEVEMSDEVQESQEMESYEHIDEVSTLTEETTDEADYVILHEENEEANMIMCEMQDDQKESNQILEVMGSLDPETGMYSVQEPSEIEHEIDEIPEHEEQEQSNYVIEMDPMNSSELDMPNLGIN